MTVDLWWLVVVFIIGMLFAGLVALYVLFSPLRQALLLAGAIKAVRESVEDLGDAIKSVAGAVRAGKNAVSNVVKIVRKIIGLGKEINKVSKGKKRARRR